MTDPALRGVRVALDQVNALLGRDGARLSLVKRRGGTLVVRYESGTSADCPTCALGGEAVVMLLKGALAQQAPAVRDVRLVSSAAGGAEGAEPQEQ
jgi:Fe-S cluster biogenesis protein NfuA